jgi:hypothetical protein
MLEQNMGKLMGHNRCEPPRTPRVDGQKFSEWVQEMFPGLAAKTASDAMWWAENSGVTPEIPDGISHPTTLTSSPKTSYRTPVTVRISFEVLGSHCWFAENHTASPSSPTPKGNGLSCPSETMAGSRVQAV